MKSTISNLATSAAYLIIFLLSMALTSAFPPIAAEFYGSAILYGYPAPIGSNVSIYDPQGNVCGWQVIIAAGEYGLLSCNGDDPSTDRDEGAVAEETVRIYIDGNEAGKAKWQEGQLIHLNLDLESEVLEPRFQAREFPPGSFLLPIFPLMVLIAIYLYLRRDR